jgi:hypothetical protein
MASVLNRFKTITVALTNTPQTVYTSPVGYTGIVLMAHVANITSSAEIVTFSHYDDSAVVETELAKDYPIPGNDAASMLTGKLIVEAGDSIKAVAGSNSSLKLTLSILESLDA